MSERESIETDPLHEELSAYLDGELDAEGVRRVEDRLARDADYQAELQRLERAWGMLERLPRATVDESFTRSTIEMVAVEASEDAEAVLAEQPRRRRRQRLWGAAAMALAGLIGFVIGTRIWADPNEELIRDLPVLENFELYYQADDIDFLRRLDAKNLYAASDADRGADETQAVATDDDDPAAQRRQIAALPPADRQELLRQQERFLALPTDEQERLRALQGAVDADPNAAHLRQTLVGYHEMLKTLSASERAKLAESPPAERVEAIESIVRRQQREREHRQRVELLTSRDMRNVVRWIEDLAWRERQRLIAEMSPGMRGWFDKQNEDRQRMALVHMALDRARRGGQNRLDIRDQDLDRLATKLSERAQAEMAKQPDLQARRRLAGGWVFSSMVERWEGGRASRRSTPLPEADVAEFFENELSDRKRDELMNLPPSKAREELRRMYWHRERGESMFRGGPAGPGGPRSDRPRPRGGGPPPDGPSIGPRGGPARGDHGSPFDNARPPRPSDAPQRPADEPPVEPEL